MTTLTITFHLPDDMDAFEKAHHAIYAWNAISESLTLIRNHLKHDQLTPVEVVAQVREILTEAQGVLQCP